jgi:hypothetical protein
MDIDTTSSSSRREAVKIAYDGTEEVSAANRRGRVLQAAG